MADKTTFLGNGWNFPPRFDDEKQAIATVSNEENVRQSLWTLLSTTPGERVHRYNYGCHIRQYAFEQMSVTTQTLLRDEIERAVILFEPRVRTDAVTFRIDNEAGILYIQLDYTVRQTNRRSNMVYPFYLNEGTDIHLK